MKRAALLLFLLACGTERPPDTEVPVWERGEPALRVGELEGDPAYQLYRVTDATLLSDGRPVVLNAGTHEVRVYGPDGALLVAFGGEGEGPQDIMRPASVLAVGDSLRVYDQWLSRLSVWRLHGTFVRVATLDPLLPGADPVG